MSNPSKNEKETHYVGESVTVTNKFHNSIRTGSASTNEKKECASNNLFNFADSCNTSNPQPIGLWANASGGGRPNLNNQNQAGDASSDNIVGPLRRLQTEHSQKGRAAKRYASVDQEEFESNISLSSYLSEANLNN